MGVGVNRVNSFDFKFVDIIVKIISDSKIILLSNTKQGVFLKGYVII